MNVFELSAVASPISGVIAGAACIKTTGIAPKLCGSATGFVIGLLIWCVAMGLSALMLHLSEIATTKNLGRRQWLASLAGVLIPAAAPLVTFTVTTLVVTRIFPA